MAQPPQFELEARDAIHSVRLHLERNGFVPLTEAERGTVGGGRFTQGWKIALTFSDGSIHTVAIVLPDGFPYTAPRLAVLGGPNVLSWPHLEDNGLLCVMPPGMSVASQLPIDQVNGLLQAGVKLIEDVITGQLDADYEREFTAYWGRGDVSQRPEVRSLLEPHSEHGEIAIWRGQVQYVVANDVASLRRWLTARYGQKHTKSLTIARALLLCAPIPLRPSDYPRTGADLARLFAADQNALDLLTLQALSGEARDVVLQVPTPTGRGLAAITLYHLAATPHRPGKRSNDLCRGFRPGTMPRAVAQDRALSPTTRATRHSTVRMDHDWIHGRDFDTRQRFLKEANVLVIGCGSLGCYVTELLARAGVGRLTLMDGEVLEWPNLGRHILGAENIGQNKATALAARLTGALPHLKEIRSVPMPLTRSNALELLDRDLIITTTGAWAVDSLVSDAQRDGLTGPVIYGWLEPHAAAAHAVFIPGRSPCLKCHMSPVGAFDTPVSEWTNGGALPIPSCGGSFTPYGATELSYAHALIAEQALEALINPSVNPGHTIWIGRTARWKAVGGRVSAAWLRSYGDPGEGGISVHHPWPPNPQCSCGRAPP